MAKTCCQFLANIYENDWADMFWHAAAMTFMPRSNGVCIIMWCGATRCGGVTMCGEEQEEEKVLLAMAMPTSTR